MILFLSQNIQNVSLTWYRAHFGSRIARLDNSPSCLGKSIDGTKGTATKFSLFGDVLTSKSTVHSHLLTPCHFVCHNQQDCTISIRMTAISPDLNANKDTSWNRHTVSRLDLNGHACQQRDSFHAVPARKGVCNCRMNGFYSKCWLSECIHTTQCHNNKSIWSDCTFDIVSIKWVKLHRQHDSPCSLRYRHSHGYQESYIAGCQEP